MDGVVLKARFECDKQTGDRKFEFEFEINILK